MEYKGSTILMINDSPLTMDLNKLGVNGMNTKVGRMVAMALVIVMAMPHCNG